MSDSLETTSISTNDFQSIESQNTNSASLAAFNPSSWINDNIRLIGDRTLKEICIPGSHDSGMSVLYSHTAFSTENNTLTQSLPIYEQLNCGIRFFDIRPVIGSPERFMTGHYSYVDITGGHQGGNGQSILSIVDDINKFTSNNKELIILEISHSLNTNVGYGSYREFNQSEWNDLFDILSRIKNLYVLSDGRPDLTLKKINHYTETSSSVIIVVTASNVDLSHANNRQIRFFDSSNLPMHSDYANKDNVESMRVDQLQKIDERFNQSPKELFVLSWTLTQQGAGTLSGPSIRQLADAANAELYSSEIFISPQCFPNIIMIDNIKNGMCAEYCSVVNNIISQPISPITKRFGMPRSFDTGINSDINVTKDGTVLEVHQSEGASTLWFHTGVIRGATIQWSGSTHYDDGVTPCAAIGGGSAIEIHKSQATSCMWFHTGTVGGGPSLSWSGSASQENGFVPKVDMNESGLFAAVCTSTRPGSCDLYSVVGRVQGGKAAWGEWRPLRGDNGHDPAIAINDKGFAIEVHAGGDGRGGLFYHFGSINADRMTIVWGPSRPYQRGQRPQVALTNDGLILMSYLGENSATIYSALGRISGSDIETATLEWVINPYPYASGDRSALSCSGDGSQGVMTIQKGRQLFSASFR